MEECVCVRNTSLNIGITAIGLAFVAYTSGQKFIQGKRLLVFLANIIFVLIFLNGSYSFSSCHNYGPLSRSLDMLLYMMPICLAYSLMFPLSIRKQGRPKDIIISSVLFAIVKITIINFISEYSELQHKIVSIFYYWMFLIYISYDIKTFDTDFQRTIDYGVILPSFGNLLVASFIYVGKTSCEFFIADMMVKNALVYVFYYSFIIE